MSKAIAFVTGAASYLLGGRADRERFDRIKEQAIRVWNDDPADQEAAASDRRA